MKCIQIFKDGKMDEINIQNIKNLTDKSINQGSDNIQELFKWNYEKYIIKCYGWYDGVNSFENEHNLPSGGNSDFIDLESNEINLYGDIFIVKFIKDKICDLTIEEYSVFYNDQFDIYSDFDSESDSDIVYEGEIETIKENNKEENKYVFDENDECTFDNYTY